MKMFTILMVIVMSAHISSAQYPQVPYQPLVFENIQPIWYKTCYDEHRVNSYCDGYNSINFDYLFPPMMDDNIIYSINETTYGGNNWGFILNARSLEDGQLIFQVHYDSINLKYQEIPKAWYMDGAHLYLIGLRKNKTYAITDPIFCEFEDNARMTFRKYDKRTGVLLESANVDEEIVDAEAIHATKYVNLPFPIITKTSDSNVFRYIENITRIKGIQNTECMVKTYLLNYRGVRVSDIDTITLSDFQLALNMQQISVDTILHFTNNAALGNDFKINLYDENLTKYQEISLEPSPYEHAVPELRVATSEYIVLVDSYPKIVDNEFVDDKIILVYDLTGRLLDHFKLDYYKSRLAWFSLDYLPKRKHLICSGTRLDDNQKLHFELYVPDKMDNLDTIFRFNIEDPNRIISGINIFEGRDDRDLIGISAFESYYKPFGANSIEWDRYAEAASLLILRPKDIHLNPLVSAQDVAAFDISTPYPNPSQGVLRLDIHGDIKKGSIHVSDLQGRNVHIAEDVIMGTNTIDLSSLPDGMYIYKVYDASKAIACGKWVKSK